MKRWIIILLLTLCGALLVTATALLQENKRPQLGGREINEQQIVAPDALPQSYLNQNRLHKLILDNKDDAAVYSQLAQAGALRNEIDYGSFKLVIVDEEALGGRAALQALPVAPRDDQNLIAFNGYVIDTSSPQPLSKELPANLKQSRMADALDRKAGPVGGLFIVQFVGPIQDAWLETLGKTGVDVITYVPSNAYVVRANAVEAIGLMQMKEQHPFVQWLGDYEPAYKLRPELRAKLASGATETIKVTVQALDGAEGDQVIDNLRATAVGSFDQRRVLKYRNVTVTIPVWRLAELANSDGVFAIEEWGEMRPMDEAQGQIVAGNLSGGVPTGPGYLSWLASKGFNSSQFTSFSVNVVDDTPTLTGHPDLPAGRVAFQNNPSNCTGPQNGHGFIDAHIVVGFNNNTGSAFEDALGFNYGLGIAPWARVGATGFLCGDFAFDPTGWENMAYSQGARISTNSFGTDPPFTTYDARAQEYDRIVRDARSGVAGNQQLITVFAAGNAGPGANTVGIAGTAKNVITVGASESVRQTGTDGCGVGNSGANNANDIIGFSSRGPVNAAGGDGRIKPDIVAPGTHIQGGIPQSDYTGTGVCDKFFPPGQTLYAWSSGTSQATPAVAGGAALLYQHFLNRGLSPPSPAMAKAYLMNSASYMNGVGAGGDLPSNSQGMGRLDLGRAFDDTKRKLIDQTHIFGATGQTFQITDSISDPSKRLRVTLVWTDAPGATTGGPWVNNLDLEVTIGGQTYKGNVFSGMNSVTGGVADGKNNAESVFLPAGMSGAFTVTVKATNIAGDGVPGNGDTTDQDFALVIFNSSCDPYADAVDSSFLVASPQNAVGAPDGQTANIVSLLGIGSLTLDMGLGEEGTGNLNVHYAGPLSAELITTVDFLAADGTVISTGTLHLADLSSGVHIATVTYSAAPTPYRFVRINGLLLLSIGIDAVEAISVRCL